MARRLGEVVLLVSLPLSPTACSPAADGPSAAALMEADRAFAAATATRGAAGWASIFAEDGMMIVPGARIVGRDSIRRYMEPALSDTSFSLDWEPTDADISDGGDLGYTIGRYTRRSGERTAGGTYLTVWRRDGAGAWRVAVDLGVPDPPGSAASDAAAADGPDDRDGG